MKRFTKMLLGDLLPSIFITQFFFVLALLLVDIFANLWTYINRSTPFWTILYLTVLEIPPGISMTLPVATLFAMTYVMGSYYANNEMIAIFSAGLSVRRFSLPIIILGVLFSFGSFYFEDNVTIPARKLKTIKKNEIFGDNDQFNDNEAIIAKGGEIIYFMEFYNATLQRLTGVVIVARSSEGVFKWKLSADSGGWEEDKWVFSNVRMYSYNKETGYLEEKFFASWVNPELDEPPESFDRRSENVKEMTRSEARDWVEALKRTGRPYRTELTEYYLRVAFSLTPLFIAFLSCSMGGWFKKNVLITSLLVCLSISVAYYVFQLILGSMAKRGLIDPLYGSWTAIIVFLLLGLILFRLARS